MQDRLQAGPVNGHSLQLLFAQLVRLCHQLSTAGPHRQATRATPRLQGAHKGAKLHHATKQASSLRGGRVRG